MKNKTVWNRVCVSWVLVAALFVAADTFAGDGKPRISISVTPKSESEKPVKISDKVEAAGRLTTTTGSTKTELCTLTVKLKNAGDQPVAGEMEWCFISDYSSGKGEPGKPGSPADPEKAPFSPGKKSVTLSAGETVSESIVSKPFVFTEKTIEQEYLNRNRAIQPRTTETGDVYKGYLVLFTVNGEVVAKKASASLYATDKWVALCRKPPAIKPPPAKKPPAKKRRPAKK